MANSTRQCVMRCSISFVHTRRLKYVNKFCWFWLHDRSLPRVPGCCCCCLKSLTLKCWACCYFTSYCNRLNKIKVFRRTALCQHNPAKRDDSAAQFVVDLACKCFRRCRWDCFCPNSHEAYWADSCAVGRTYHSNYFYTAMVWQTTRFYFRRLCLLCHACGFNWAMLKSTHASMSFWLFPAPSAITLISIFIFHTEVIHRLT